MGMQNDRPNVIALPPLIYAAFFAAGLVLEFFWRTHVFSVPVRVAIGLLLLAAGFLMASQAVREFKRADTNVEVYKPATSLVTSGLYRYSRNPIYVGLTLAYLGAGLLADSLWVLVLLIPVLVLIHYGVILREEEYLQRKFGAAYFHYVRSVRRWL